MNKLTQESITRDELDVIMASLAVGFMVSTLDNETPIIE